MKPTSMRKLKAKTAPVVELDSGAHSAYVRFSRLPVSRTEIIEEEGPFVTMDFANDDSVIGIELVGVKEFTLTALTKFTKGSFDIPKHLQQRARYVPAAATSLQAVA
jgi:hypothetical protein